MMAVLLLLVALIAPSIAQIYNYFPPPCPSPPTQCDINTDSLYPTTYVTIVPNIGDNYLLDNICHTFFPNNDEDCTYTGYYSFVYRDGSTKILTYIISADSTDSFSLASTGCSFTESYLSNDGNEMVTVRQVNSGSCPDIYPVVVGYVCPYDGTTNDLPRIQQILANNGYGYTDLIVLPRARPYNCINSQASSSTGSTANCPGQYLGGDSRTTSYPNYNYNSPSYTPYSYNPPPSSCGCTS